MPTISPPRTVSETSWTATAPASSIARSLLSSSRASPNCPTRGGCTVSSSAPIIMRAMLSGVRSATLPLPASLPRRRIVTSSANAITSRNLCVIIRMVRPPFDDHVAQHAQHLVGFARRQHRGRLVEDEKAPLQIKLLQDFAFLPLAGGNVGNPGVERHLERHPRQERFQLLLFLAPS